MRYLYLIDFDGTLSSYDSTKMFFKKISNKIQFIYYYYLAPFKHIVNYHLFRGDSFSIKKCRMFYFLKNISKMKIDEYLAESGSYINEILKKGALDFIRVLKQNPQNDVYIVSAGNSLALAAWTEKEGINLITNIFNPDFTTKDDIYVHEYDCDRAGKVLRVKSEINIEKYSEIYAYGDTPNDFMMFIISDKFKYRSLEMP